MGCVLRGVDMPRTEWVKMQVLLNSNRVIICGSDGTSTSSFTVRVSISMEHVQCISDTGKSNPALRLPFIDGDVLPQSKVVARRMTQTASGSARLHSAVFSVSLGMTTGCMRS